MKKLLKNSIALASLALLATSCGSKEYVTYYNTGENIITGDPYSFSNSEAGHAKPGDEIKIDGVLDDKVYEDLNWLNVSYPLNDTTIDVDMTAYVADSGLYIAINCNDPSVYYNRNRNNSFNSGIEMYMAVGGATNLRAPAYEVDFTAAGIVTSRFYHRNGWAPYIPEPEITPYIQSRILGAPLNSGESEGYVMEVFMPYKFFGLTEAPSYFDLNPTLIRAFDSTTNKDRLWYNFAEHNRPGYSFGNPESFWHFTSKGLDANRIRIQTIGNGSVKAVKEVIEVGGSGQLIIKPDEGNYLKSLVINGVDVTGNISLRIDDAIYNTSTIKEDLNVVATFEPLPANAYQISGAITIEGYSLTKEEREDIVPEFVYGASIIKGTMSNSGKYTIDVPSGNGVFRLVSKKDNYVILSENVDIVSSLIKDIDLNAHQYGDDKDIMFNDVYGFGNSKMTEIADASPYLEKSTHNQTLFFKVKVKNFSFFNEDGTINHTPTGADHELYNFMIKPYLFTQGTNTGIIQFQILHWNGAWTFKCIIDGKNTVVGISAGDMRMLETKGLAFAIDLDEGRYVSFYKESGTSYQKMLTIDTETVNPNRKMGNIYSQIDNPVGSIWDITDIRLRSREDGESLGFDENGQYSNIFSVLKSTISNGYQNKQVSAVGVYTNASNPLPIDDSFVAYAKLKYEGVVNSNGEMVIHDGLMLGTNLHLYKADNSTWLSRVVRIAGTSTGYQLVFGANNSATIIDTKELNAKQISLIASDGLDYALIHDGDKKLHVYLNDGEGQLTEVFTESSFVDAKFIKYLDGLFYVDGTTDHTGLLDGYVLGNFDDDKDLTASQLFNKYIK